MIDRIRPERKVPDNLTALAEALVDMHGASLRTVQQFLAGTMAFAESQGLLKELHQFMLNLDEIDKGNMFNKTMLDKMIKRDKG